MKLRRKDKFLNFDLNYQLQKTNILKFKTF